MKESGYATILGLINVAGRPGFPLRRDKEFGQSDTYRAYTGKKVFRSGCRETMS
jgi:hypothetical protein